MFETLFSYPGVVQRHREGPLAAERIAHLQQLADIGIGRGTLLRRCAYCLCVAIELQRWPTGRSFDAGEVDRMAAEWAAGRVCRGRASDPRWPAEHFRIAATDFLQSLGRLRAEPAPAPERYEAELAEFIVAQQEGRWQSEATCRSGRWQVRRLLNHLEQRGVALKDVQAVDVDAFFEHMAQRWSRSSLRTSGKILRAWFRYCESRSWVQSGISEAILLPRIYRHEGLPLGPTWDTVGQVLSLTSGDKSKLIRDHAIILLLAVYGLRSGEVRRLRLDDIDWHRDSIRIVRSKSKRTETPPLDPRVGNAIARYVRAGRPKADHREVFLTVRAPFRPLSAGGLYHIIEQHLSEVGPPKKGRGPHGLRHACARHLVESGRSFKEVGDHLGHRSPDSTQVYAKVDLASLRQVAFDDLGGIS
jgi:site-specific recombinase XerD